MPFAAWAIARDGRRGLAIAETAPRAQRVSSRHANDRAHPIPGAVFTASPEERSDEDREDYPFDEDDETLGVEGDLASPVGEAVFASELAALEAEALDAMAGGAVSEPLASFAASGPAPGPAC